MKFECDHEGCERSVKKGDALYRVSAKGEEFVGLCSEHYAGPKDPIARAIEESNRLRREEQPRV